MAAAARRLFDALRSFLPAPRLPATSAILAIREFSSIEAGHAAVAAAGRGFPFIVRGASREFASESALRSQLALEDAVTGYAGGQAFTATGSRCLQDWDAGKLAFNVIDSASTRGRALLPAVLERLGQAAGVAEGHRLAYVLSPASDGSPSFMHVDPPNGSGWQFLFQGTKQWTILDAEAFDLEAYKLGSAGSDGEREELHAETMARHSAVYGAALGPGDFLSCPLNWPHGVRTEERSIGLSGYTAAPELKALAAAGAADEAARAVRAVEAAEQGRGAEEAQQVQPVEMAYRVECTDVQSRALPGPGGALLPPQQSGVEL